jgi:uncharacterized membrane protein (UPF0127 family)
MIKKCLLFCFFLLQAVPATALQDVTLYLQPAAAEETAITVWLAADESTRRTGLMHRTSLDGMAGMWFDFGEERAVSMWMKNTPMALDMVFVAADGTIRHLIRATEPFSLTPLPSLYPVRYVLEIPAGMAAHYHLQPGDRIRWDTSSPSSP